MDRTLWIGWSRTCKAVGLFAIIGLGGAAVVAAADDSPDAVSPSTASPGSKTRQTGGGTTLTLEERVNQSLRLKASKVINLDVAPTPDAALNVPIAIEGRTYTMALSPHSVRSPNYQLRAQLADGSYVNVDPGPDRMLRGSLVEAPGSQISGGLLEDGLHVTIRLPDGKQLWTEPLGDRVPGAAADQYVLYRTEDIIHPEGHCGVDAAFLQAHPPMMVPDAGNGGSGGVDGSTVFCVELAADADVEYYQSYSSSVTNVQNRINLVVNTMNLQYLNELDMQFVITQIIVRTAEPDPYSSTDGGTLLNQVQNHWNANQGAVPRDVVQLFTAKNIAGGTIGIAITPSTCSIGNAYSLVQSDCCGGLGCATDLSAHELGHTLGAGHCSCPSNTMNPSITCANVHAASSISQIIAYRNSVSCLTSCADATLPFFDDFPSTTFNSGRWTTISGAVIDTVASGTSEPSDPLSMRLRGSTTGGHQARTSRINASGLGQFDLSFWYERRGGGDSPETGDDLVVEYFNSSGNWVEINRQLGSGPDMTTFSQVTLSFPADAKHSEFRRRFRAISNQNNLDDWFVDDVSIIGVAAPSNDLCANTINKGAGSHPFTTIGATTDGPSEPGGCNFAGFSQIDNDIWFKYAPLCTGTATISLCGADYNAKLAIYPNTCPAGGGTVIACNDDFCGAAPEISFPVTAGTVSRIRVGGTNGARGSGTMVISCVPSAAPCPADVTHDSQVNVNDLLMLINSWGPCPVPPVTCPADVVADGQINVNDLLAVINGWGSCP